jgi:hypothetical protein
MSLENLNSKGLEAYIFYNRFAANGARVSCVGPFVPIKQIKEIQTNLLTSHTFYETCPDFIGLLPSSQL